MKPNLEVQNLKKTFSHKKNLFSKRSTFQAIKGIDFSLGQGETLGILGPNGAGKTTTIHMLLSILKPTSGSIRYFGQDFQTHREQSLQHVSFASTYVRLPWRLTVRENLDIYGRLYGLSHSERKSRIDKLLNDFEVSDQKNKLMNALSAGQVTRVMLAKAFLSYPKIVLLDEPTASLDPNIARKVRKFITKQREQFGVSILITSHNMDEVTEICDRVIFLSKGTILDQGTPSELAKKSFHSTLSLSLSSGQKQLFNYLKEKNIQYSSNKTIDIFLPETQIAPLLQSLPKEVQIFDIHIKKPTLEQYFLEKSDEQKHIQ